MFTQTFFFNSGSLRKNLWDAEDRLWAVDLDPESDEDKPLVAIYTYDAGGERTIKYVPARIDSRYSAKESGHADRFESILYPSALLTAKTITFPEITGQEKDPRIMTYTKHYYIGSERIVSVLGTKRGMGAYCATERAAVRDELNDKVTAAGEAIEEVFEYFGKHIQLPQPFVYSDSNAYPCSSTQVPEDYGAYWYHPDHLGSSSYITNLDGEISQHMEYLPFGETLVEEHLNSNNSPYKFNAKEFDAETGNYYYGARYYDPKWSVWLSVDPLAEDYPGWSPYNFTFNNPIRFIDPDGRMAVDVIPPGDYYDTKGNWLYNDGIDDNKVYEVSQMPGVAPGIAGSGETNIKYLGQVENVKMTFTGEANSQNPKQGDGQLNIIQEVSNGKEYTRATFDAVGGPWGNGSPENGDYLVNTLLDRGPTGWYNKGMTVDGIGFSLNLDPQFETGRTLLRIHPDGNLFGTQGCIGLTCGKSGLIRFRSLIQSTLSKQSNIPLNINILNNPNNNGYGRKVISNGE